MHKHTPRAAAALAALAFATLTGCAGDGTSTTQPDDNGSAVAVTDPNQEQSTATSDTTVDEPADQSRAMDDAELAVPEVSLAVVSDPAGGITISVATAGFEVAPRAVSTDAVPGQGHYLLYIDGEKVLRFYNDDIYFGGVVPGEVTVGVVLAGNDHRPLTHDGEPVAAELQFTVPEHDHSTHSHEEMGPVTFGGPAPMLDLEVVADPTEGFNAFLTVDGLVLSADNASGDPVDGEGHLHIYVNGAKLGRLYGPATHIPVLPAGEVEVRVAAYSNDHRPYVVDGVPVEATVTVSVPS